MSSLIAPLPAVPLWREGAPGALGTADNDIPTLTAYLPCPEKATGAAIVVLPGGGCWVLADHEGEPYAQWLADQGIAAFVLKYRLIPNGYYYPTSCDDAVRAMRLVRARSEEWNIDPNRVGIMGSSAGANLSGHVLTRYDSGNAASPDPIERESSRPSLGIFCYGGFFACEELADITSEQKAAFKQFYGKEPTSELIDDLSTERHLTNETAPCFIWQTLEDTHSVANPIRFGMALAKKEIRFELHIYEKGKHGIGLGGSFPGTLHRWTDDCMAWLREQSFARLADSE